MSHHQQRIEDRSSDPNKSTAHLVAIRMVEAERAAYSLADVGQPSDWVVLQGNVERAKLALR